MTYIYTEYDYLAHHGIKGMKWGVRKRRRSKVLDFVTGGGPKVYEHYKNGDYEIPPKEKYNMNKERHRKKAISEYNKLARRAEYEVSVGNRDRYVTSYNDVARRMNSGGIATYNKHNSPKDPEYENNYHRCFNSMVTIKYNNETTKATLENRNFKKARNLARELDLGKYDKNVKESDDFENYIKSVIAKHLKNIPSYMRPYM